MHHGPFGLKISMIPNGPWCYGLGLLPRFTGQNGAATSPCFIRAWVAIR